MREKTRGILPNDKNRDVIYVAPFDLNNHRFYLMKAFSHALCKIDSPMINEFQTPVEIDLLEI
jgi:hypothetical protein